MNLNFRLQEVCLGMLRNDVIFCHKEGPKQVEINSIASGLAHLGPMSLAVHRFVALKNLVSCIVWARVCLIEWIIWFFRVSWLDTDIEERLTSIILSDSLLFWLFLLIVSIDIYRFRVLKQDFSLTTKYSIVPPVK